MGSSDRLTIIADVAHALSKAGVKNSSSVLVAVSGGVDSMTLVYIMNELRKKGHLKKLSLVHINHSLRGKESDKDEVLVKQYAKKLNIPVYSFSVDTKASAGKEKIGIEEAARLLRYEKMIHVSDTKKYGFLATAHTVNDQVETVLMNIVRGTGLNGLQGIPASRKLSDTVRLIRPMLAINKSDLRSFAKVNNIPFREDESNKSLDFQRNRVRLQVLPALEKAFKERDIYAGFSKMTQNIASVADYIESEVKALRMKAVADRPSFFIQRRISVFERSKLVDAPDFLRRELIILEASALSGHRISIDQIRWLLLESYLAYPSKKSFPLTKEMMISHDGKFLAIESIDTPPGYEYLLEAGKKVLTPVGFIAAKKVKKWEKPKNQDNVYFNYGDIGERKLLIRFWKHGDKIKPFGMKGKSKLVSDILNEAGIKSERLKYFVPLIVFQDDPKFILWIPGVRSAEFGRLSAKSETALELRRIIK